MELSFLGRCFIAFLAAYFLGAEHLSSYPVPVDFDGMLLSWKDPERVTYETKGADKSYTGWVDQAAQMWSQVEGSRLRLVKAASGETAQIVVHLVDALEGSSYSSGFAQFDSFDTSGPLRCSAYIYAPPGAEPGYVAKTILHELGHCVGLGHSLIPEAVMSYHLDKNGFRLDIDDQAALTTLYPQSQQTPELPLGCTVGSSKGLDPIYLIMMLVLLRKKSSSLGPASL